MLIRCLTIVSIIGLLASVPAYGQVCGDPDPSVLLLDDADIRHVFDATVMTVIADPFPDGSMVGNYLAVRRYEDRPVEFFRIIDNEHFDQDNISTFTVDQVIEGGGDWWYYDCCWTFDIVGAVDEGPSLEDPTFTDSIAWVLRTRWLLHVSDTVSFLEGGQVGQWLGIAPGGSGADLFFEILYNTTWVNPAGNFVNLFIVDGDLANAGGPYWWRVPGQDRFTIYEPCG